MNAPARGVRHGLSMSSTSWCTGAGAASAGAAAIAAAAVLALGVTGGARAGASARSCGPAGARTLVRSGAARIYSPDRAAARPLAPRVFGCAVGSARQVSLGGGARQFVEHPALGGRFAAYGLRAMGVDTGYTRVRVVDLRSARILDDTPAASSPGRPESIHRPPSPGRQRARPRRLDRLEKCDRRGPHDV